MNKIEVVKTLMNAEKQYGWLIHFTVFLGKVSKLMLDFLKNARDSSIEELALPVRRYNALRHANVSTIEVLIELLNEDRLEKIRNLGAKSISGIQTKFLVFGFERLSKIGKKIF